MANNNVEVDWRVALEKGFFSLLVMTFTFLNLNSIHVCLHAVLTTFCIPKFVIKFIKFHDARLFPHVIDLSNWVCGHTKTSQAERIRSTHTHSYLLKSFLIKGKKEWAAFKGRPFSLCLKISSGGFFRGQAGISFSLVHSWFSDLAGKKAIQKMCVNKKVALKVNREVVEIWSSGSTLVNY